MRLAFLMSLLLLAPGCVAFHRITFESEPSGVHVEVNGEYVGQTPVDYFLESPYAETIWPYEVTIVGRKPQRGWKPDVKHFEARSPLPGKIFFVLERDASKQGSRRSKARDRDVRGSEYETLEEQKKRLRSW